MPELKIRAVVLGSLILMITAANHLGLNSAFLVCRAIFLRSSLTPMLTVLTMFCSWGMMLFSVGWCTAGDTGAGLERWNMLYRVL